jgi:hypothetical protein
MLKKIVCRTGLLILILVSLNGIYSKWFYERDIQRYSAVINLVRALPTSTDIIYIGESSNITFRHDDADKRPISDFIGDYYPGLKIHHITKPAAHAGIFKVLLDKIPDDNSARTLVVTLNLRSFDAQWIYSNLETSLRKSLVLLNPYPPLVNRFLLSFKAYDLQSETERIAQFKSKWKRDVFHLPFEFPFDNVMEWDNWMARNGATSQGGQVDPSQVKLACHYIKAYGFQLDTASNPRISDFNEIISLARQRGWGLVFNLMAENTAKAQQLVGDELVFMMTENARILKDYFGPKGVLVVDNLNAVEDKDYIDQNWTTEHYSEKGRKTIARNVAIALKKWHGHDFDDSACNARSEKPCFLTRAMQPAGEHE